MKDLAKLVDECCADLIALGYKPCENIEWSVNTRAKKRWGQCRYTSQNSCAISISWQLLQDGVSDQAAKNTILHELIHTLRDHNGKPASKHTGLWLQVAHIVNAKYPQYTIKRTTSSTEKGLRRITLFVANIVGTNITGRE